MARTKYTLRPEQETAVAGIRRFLETAPAGGKCCYASPTGTGKSLIALEAAHGNGTWIVTPRVEIVRGMLEKLGATLIGVGEERVVELGLAERITTPVRLRNLMLRGDLPEIPRLIVDEGHHAEAETYTAIDMLTGSCPAVALTATPFRGTPAGTKAFRDKWGQPQWVVSYAGAMHAGYLSFPRCKVLPLLDDDLIEVTNGEFQVSAVSEAVGSRIQAVVQHCMQYARQADGGSVTWDTPTMFAVPSTEVALTLTEALIRAGLPAVCVTQATSQVERQKAFVQCVACTHALVQINVVSEGVDLPIRRLIDLAPTLSPVKWLQQFGRITRPGGASHYVCTNRNLLRHAYLLEGCIPPACVAEAEKLFGGPGKRAANRVIGLEAIGRLKAAELPLLDGTTGLMYQVSAVRGTTVTEYTVLVHPAKATPLWAKRSRGKATDTTPAWYGRWERCAAPEGLQGFASVPPAPLSDKQAAWWVKSANRYGLDPRAKVTRKNFAALPVLSDLRQRL